MAKALKSLSKVFNRLRVSADSRGSRNNVQSSAEMESTNSSASTMPSSSSYHSAASIMDNDLDNLQTNSDNSSRKTEKRKMQGRATTSENTVNVAGAGFSRHSHLSISTSSSSELRMDIEMSDTLLHGGKRHKSHDTEPIASRSSDGLETLNSGAGCSHQYVFRVASGHQGENLAGEGSSESCQLRRNSTNSEVRVPCEMGDVWTQAYFDQPLNRHKDVSTNDEYTDRALHSVQYKGYVLQEQLSVGKFSAVLLAGSNKKTQRRHVALKFLIGESARDQHANASKPPWKDEEPKEAQILIKLNHSNIVEFVEYWPLNGRPCLVLEYCDGGNMQQLLSIRSGCGSVGFLTEPVARRYFQQMQGAVEYLHHQCIVHRDICPSNMLLDSYDNVKLVDFRSAMAWQAGDPFRHDHPGTPAYQAPEYFNPQEGGYNPRQADIWSLGLTLFVMTTGRLPLDSEVNQPSNEPSYEDMEGDYSNDWRVRGHCLTFPSPLVLKLSADIHDVLDGMCKFNPDHRFTLTRVACSPWFRKEQEKVFIGNFHLARQPRKVKVGLQEEEYKAKLHV